jgi:broad specificity phosphatase PhoE
MTTFLLVRHGQTELNLAERFRGRSEAPLNETGLAQAEAVARRIAAGWKPAAIYTSPLSRATQTSDAIARACGITLQLEPGLIDIDFGDWQGLSFNEARQRWPQEIENWRYRPHQCQIPNGESLGDVSRRAMEAIHHLGKRHPDDTIVLVGHTVTNQLLLLGILDLGIDHFWRLRQGNCALNVIEFREGAYILASMNDTAHLAGLPG